MKNEPNFVSVCPRHLEYPVVVISTFAFNGAELWCPYCGMKAGMFDVNLAKSEETDELAARTTKYAEHYNPYLRAHAQLVAAKTKYNDEWIRPADLPEEEKEKSRVLRETGWKQFKKAEEL